MNFELIQSGFNLCSVFRCIEHYYECLICPLISEVIFVLLFRAGDTNDGAHLYALSGLIESSKMNAFETMVWRVSRGNVYFCSATEDKCCEDPINSVCSSNLKLQYCIVLTEKHFDVVPNWSHLWFTFGLSAVVRIFIILKKMSCSRAKYSREHFFSKTFN